jgi:hypothetical protein
MQNPIPRDDRSLREDNNHVEREPTVNIGKEGKCMRLKEITLMTLFGMENDHSGRTHVCTITVKNGT